MYLTQINPYIRVAEIQPSILEGDCERFAYDNRLFYVFNGSGQIIIDNISYDIKPNSLIFIPTKIGYYFVGKLQVAVLNFDISRNAEDKTIPICPSNEKNYKPSLIFDNAKCKELSAPIVLLEGTIFEYYVKKIIEQWNCENKWKDSLTSSILKTLLIEILKQLDESVNVNPNNVLCEQIITYIKLHLTEKLNNNIISEKFGYHPVYLGEIFKSVTGKTLHNEIIYQRLLLAQKYLICTNLSIEEIALYTNFSSRSHFCATFKKYLNTSPLTYRSKQQPMFNL